MTIYEQLLADEKQRLSPYGFYSGDSRGRRVPIEECPFRTPFSRDRDRVVHCKSFRRLKHKTQVFLAPEGDHYRTRLTHTLEVSQIARTIARVLRLNEDLTEAVSLGHDLGHTPFGHAGERALDEICPHGYKHYLQSVRVVEFLENGGAGLNLTWEVKNGIACHTKGQEAATLEGRVVRIADKIAYINHDIEDAITAGVLSENDIPYDVHYVLGRTKSQRITSLIRSVVENSRETIRMGEPERTAFDKLHDFMFDSVYTNPVAKGEEGKARDLIKRLYEYFTDNPDKMTEEYRIIAGKTDVARGVCDYISGMTDRYALYTYENIFVPKFWNF